MSQVLHPFFLPDTMNYSNLLTDQFDYHIRDNFRTLLHSGTLCVPSETERTSDLAGFIRRSRASRAYLTPSVLRTLKPEHVPTLRYICVGGEPIDSDLEEEWAGHVIFIHLYGGKRQRDQDHDD